MADNKTLIDLSSLECESKHHQNDNFNLHKFCTVLHRMISGVVVQIRVFLCVYQVHALRITHTCLSSTADVIDLIVTAKQKNEYKILLTISPNCASGRSLG